MNKKQQAARIIINSIKELDLSDEERMIEIKAIKEDDNLLLEYINMTIQIMEEAKKEIELG